MSDISNQLIKDSFNYVLQSDLSTGIVYRIGGLIPVNPIFQSGLTVTGGFTYSGAGEQLGYALLTDGTGYAYWGPVSATTPSSGVTSITVGNGLSANSSTGEVTIVFTGSTNVSGLTYYVTGSTPSGSTFISGDRWFNTTNGDELVYVNDGDSQQWIQICCGGSGGGGGEIVTITGGTNIQIVGSYPNFGINFTGTTTGGTATGDYLPLSGGTVTGGTIFQSGLTANTISATTYQNLPSSFQSVRINNTTQFSANTGTFLNFSGINITITSAATNTLVFSAATGGGGGGVTQITAGNGISISPTGGTGNVRIDATTFIASSSLVIVPDSSIYVGNSIYGWNSTTWDLIDTSFIYPNINCGIPLPINVEEGQTINICGIAYLDGSGDTTKCDFGVYLYKFDCANVYRNGITIVSSGVTEDALDSNGLYCFNLSYNITKATGSEFSACTDFLTVGFSTDSAGDSTESRITFTINAS